MTSEATNDTTYRYPICGRCALECRCPGADSACDSLANRAAFSAALSVRKQDRARIRWT